MALHRHPQIISCVHLGYLFCNYNVDHLDMVKSNLQRLSEPRGLFLYPFQYRKMVVRRVYHFWFPSGEYARVF